MMTEATYYVFCFAWAEDMIEEVDCPYRTSLPFDLGFFDMLQRKDKVNTFGIKEDVRDVLLFAGILEVYVMVGNLEFCPGGGRGLLYYDFQPPRDL